MIRGGITYEHLPPEVDLQMVRTVMTGFYTTKSHLELCNRLIEEVHAQAIDAGASRVWLGRLEFQRNPDLGLQAYTLVILERNEELDDRRPSSWSSQQAHSAASPYPSPAYRPAITDGRRQLLADQAAAVDRAGRDPTQEQGRQGGQEKEPINAMHRLRHTRVRRSLVRLVPGLLMGVRVVELSGVPGRSQPAPNDDRDDRDDWEFDVPPDLADWWPEAVEEDDE